MKENLTVSEQHQELIHLINQVESLFKQALEGDGDLLETRKALESLSIYTARHFEVKEKRMSKNGTPDLERHMEEHKSMIRLIDSMTIDRINQSEETALIHFFAFLRDCVDSHILKE